MADGGNLSVHDTMGVAEWLAPGRKTVEGYLYVSKGRRKKSYGNSLNGLFAELVADKLEESGRTFPRWPDLHAVWFGFDPEREPNYRMVKPLVRYKRSRPVDGLRSSCDGHRVRLTASFGQPFTNGLGAYITRASGVCLDCDQ